MKNFGKTMLVLGVLIVAAPVLLAMLAAILALPMLGFSFGYGWMHMSRIAGPLLFVAIVCVILLFAFLAAKALGSAAAGNGEALSADEVRLMQDLNSGLSRLEERIEALETLLLDKRAGAADEPDRA